MTFVAALHRYSLYMSRISLGLLTLCICLIVFLRFFLSLGWVWLQELATYLHAFAFLLMLAYALRENEHVRVDLFYQKFSLKTKAWVQIAGNLLFLIPTSAFIFYQSYPYVVDSWSILEGSLSVGGLPFLYILKSMLVVFPILLILEAFANTYLKWCEVKDL